MEFIDWLPGYFWLVVHFGPAALSVYHALLYKRDSGSAMGWIMACVFVPFAGPVAYFFFGINRIRSRAHGLRTPFYIVDYESGAKREYVPSNAVDSQGIEAAGQKITGRPIVRSNDVKALHHGDAAYPAMLEAIASAEHRVLLATYIFKADQTGSEFMSALEAAVTRGVDVKVLLDGFGELYSLSRVSTRLRERGIAVARFLPPKLLPPNIYVNLRNHRKILAVDGRVGFAGGINISDGNIALDGRPRSISDLHFQICGPAVTELERIFADDWRFAAGSSLELGPATNSGDCGQVACRVVPDGPDSDLDSLALTIQAAMSAATESIDIMTPYFLPNRDLLATLLSAVLRGARVRIVLPAKNNLWYIHWANRNVLADLLRWDAEVYYQPPPFCHSKLLCIDDAYSLIGSANLDARSLRLNFEVGIEAFSTGLCGELREHFEEVIAASAPVSYEALGNRPVPVRLRDSAAALLSPYL